MANMAGAGGAKKATAAGVVAGGAAASAAAKTEDQQKECPPDVNELGRSTWTFLHAMGARYPETPSLEQQKDMTNFISLFSKLYPCWFCAKDFQAYISKEETKPRVRTQEEFNKWLCDAHNEVNVKLGKPEFDCSLWKQRWKDGWNDGSCD